jgi:hypothetical protein
MRREHTYRIDGDGATITRAISAREAIVIHCQECFGFGARKDEECSSPLCALYPFSPFGSGSRTGRHALLGKAGKRGRNMNGRVFILGSETETTG